LSPPPSLSTTSSSRRAIPEALQLEEAAPEPIQVALFDFASRRALFASFRLVSASLRLVRLIL
jgi:hypothetical protein